MAQSRKPSATYHVNGPLANNKYNDSSNQDAERPGTPVLQYYKVLSELPAGPLEDDCDVTSDDARIFFVIKDKGTQTPTITNAPTTSACDSILPPPPPPTTTPVPSTSSETSPVLDDEDYDFSSSEEDNGACALTASPKSSRSFKFAQAFSNKAAALTNLLPKKKSKKEEEIVYTGIIKPRNKGLLKKCVNKVMKGLRKKDEDF